MMGACATLIPVLQSLRVQRKLHPATGAATPADLEAMVAKVCPAALHTLRVGLLGPGPHGAQPAGLMRKPPATWTGADHAAGRLALGVLLGDSLQHGASAATVASEAALASLCCAPDQIPGFAGRPGEFQATVAALFGLVNDVRGALTDTTIAALCAAEALK